MRVRDGAPVVMVEVKGGEKSRSIQSQSILRAKKRVSGERSFGGYQRKKRTCQGGAQSAVGAKKEGTLGCTLKGKDQKKGRGTMPTRCNSLRSGGPRKN